MYSNFNKINFFNKTNWLVFIAAAVKRIYKMYEYAIMQIVTVKYAHVRLKFKEWVNDNDNHE